MTLLRFIEDTLPGLAASLRDTSCEHVIITASSGRWRALMGDTWCAQEGALSTDALAILEQMCSATPAHNEVARFDLKFLGADTITLERLAYDRALSLPDDLEEAIDRLLDQGASGLILGSPAAPKEELCWHLATRLERDPTLYVTARPIKAPPAHIVMIPPVAEPHSARTIALADAVFWELAQAPSELARRFAQPGATSRWCVLDARDPEATFHALASAHLARAIDAVFWLEPQHTQAVPVLIERQQERFVALTGSPLAASIAELANRSLPIESLEPSASVSSPMRVIEPPNANIYGDLRISAQAAALEAQSALDASQNDVASLLQTHVTPTNHLLSTHPGFGSRTQQEESEPEEVHAGPAPLLSEEDVTQAAPVSRARLIEMATMHASDSRTIPEISALPPEALTPLEPHDGLLADEAPTHQTDALAEELITSLDDQGSEPLELNDLIDDEPDIIGESELPAFSAEILTGPTALPEEDPTEVVSRGDFAALLGNPHIMDELAEDELDRTGRAAAPYDELKRMERELMQAAHSETTGLHEDLLVSTSPRSGEDDIATDIKGASHISLPDDSEIFSSLTDASPPTPARPQPPAGLWPQDNHANEPTQMIDIDAQGGPSPLSWDDDEHTKQRPNEPRDATAPPQSADNSTTTKLSTLSDRIKALRERQRKTPDS